MRRFVLPLAVVFAVFAVGVLVYEQPAPEPGVSEATSLADMEIVGLPEKPRANPLTYRGDNAQKRLGFEQQRLVDPRTGALPAGIRRLERLHAARMPQALAGFGKNGSPLAESWELRGPINLGGRTRAIAIDQRYDGTSNRTIFAGGISGGLYRSQTGGASWELVTSRADLASITTIAQDPTSPDTWYYGTGEFLGNSASEPGGFFFGQGIFKSVDGGQTWEQLASTTNGEYTSFDNPFDFVWQLDVHPADGAVLAAAVGGIYRSTDGGQTWTNTLGSTQSPFALYSHVDVASDGSVYAAVSRNGQNVAQSGVFRSTDGGQTWSDISPADLTSDPYRMIVGHAPSDPDRMYLLVQSEPAGGSSTDHQFFRYDDGDWTDLSAMIPNVTEPDADGSEPLAGNASYTSQGGYDMVVAVKPDDEDIVWIGGTNLYRSLDAGETFETVGGYASPYTFAPYDEHHPDQHGFAFYPGDPDRMISTHDSGISFTDDPLQSPQRWTRLVDGYITSQFYHVSIDPQVGGSDLTLGGLQDNGTWGAEDPDGAVAWFNLTGGDGAYSAVAPGGDVFYVSAQEGFIFRVEQQGGGLIGTQVTPAGPEEGDFPFITPFVLDPTDSEVMYLAAGTSVWRNSDLSAIPTGEQEPTDVNWEAIEVDLDVTTVNAASDGTVYYGASDGGTTELGRIDDPASGDEPVDITPGGVVAGSYPIHVGIHPSDPEEILAAFSNYTVPKLWHSTDAGESWTDVSGNLAGDDGPSARWTALVPTGSGPLYLAGTSTGLYSTRTLAGSATEWQLEGADVIGNVVVSSIAVRPDDGLVVVATHGRGVYAAQVDVAGVSNEVAEVPGQARLLTPFPNPFTAGTTIAYELDEPAEIHLRVYDASGRSVASLAEGRQAAGAHEVTWTASGLASGLYLVRLETPAGTAVQRIVLNR